MNFSVTQYGKPFHDYKWDEETKTFSTNESGLVIDFSGIDFVTFKTGPECTFYTGVRCTFKTGDGCTFYTGRDCNFNTGWYCAFTTDAFCNFKTGPFCKFKTGNCCTFQTGNMCNFNTGDKCIFHTGDNSTFNAGENCVAIRYDVKGITEIPQGKTIRFNEYGIAGYTEVLPTHTIANN